MLPKVFRITQEKDFSLIYRRGQRVSGNLLRLTVLRTNQNATRFGFVIGKKESPKATARNRFKRILRAEVRERHKRIKTGYDVIIQGRSGSRTVAPAQLRAEFEKLLSKAKLIA